MAAKTWVLLCFVCSLGYATLADIGKSRIYEVHLKNKLQMNSKILWVRCDSVLDTPVRYEIIPYGRELKKFFDIDPDSLKPFSHCEFHSDGKSQKFLVSGRGTVCSQPGAACIWEAEDGFYIVAGAVSKLVYSLGG